MKFIYFYKKIVLSALFVLLMSGITLANKLSDRAQISILTCGQGSELYTIFGHSAIRVVDPASSMDIVFNYGVFDFRTPNFYWKFATGKLEYLLDISNFPFFERSYIREKRDMREQVLDLSQVQKQKLFDNLVINYQPENRAYLYDFLKDNCSTRVIDMLETSLGDSLHFSYGKYKTGKTYSAMLKGSLDPSPWIKLGLPILLGTKAEKVLTLREHTFLPNYLELALSDAKIVRNGEEVKLVSQENQLLQFPPLFTNFKWYQKPAFFLWLIFVAISLFTFWQVKYNKTNFIFDRFLFSSIGLLSCLFLFMWLFSEHKSMHTNHQLLWAVPFHLIFAFMLKKKTGRKYFNFFAYYYLVFNFVALFFQDIFDLALAPVFLSLAIRAMYIGKLSIKKS